MVVEGRQGRGERGHPGGDADRHREGVVNQQRGARHQGGGNPQVFLGDGVGAAAGGVGVERLPVGDHHHQRQQADPRADGDGVEEGQRQPDGCAGSQSPQNLFGGVGGGGKVVGGQHRQRGALGQTLVLEGSGFERVPDEQVLEMAQHMRCRVCF